MSSIALPSLSEDRDLGNYLREIRSFPVLTCEEEFRLARLWREQGNTDAAHKLVTSHLRLVVKIASQYRKFAVPFGDLISEGTIGLMKAVRKFDPEKGYRLATYAMWWIKSQITEFVLKSWSLVRIGSITVQKRLFFHLHRVRERVKNLENLKHLPATPEIVAQELGLSPADVIYLGHRLENRDISLNEPSAKFDEGEGEARIDQLADDAINPENHVAKDQERAWRRRIIEAVIAELPKREREIIKARWLSEDGATLEALGQRFGISRERIRQLEKRALGRVREGICKQLGTVSPAEISSALLEA